MKKNSILFSLLATVSVAHAQTSPPYPAGAPIPNATGTNVSSAALSTLLLNLRTNVQQLLPILAALNDSTLLNNTNHSIYLSNGARGNFTDAYPAGPQSANYGSYGALPSADLPAHTNSISTFPGGSTITTLPNTPETPTSINGTNTAALMAIANHVGGVATNGTGLTPAEQERLRALIILQNDLERMLPLLLSLNETAPPGTGSSNGTNAAGTANLRPPSQ